MKGKVDVIEPDEGIDLSTLCVTVYFVGSVVI